MCKALPHTLVLAELESEGRQGAWEEAPGPTHPKVLVGAAVQVPPLKVTCPSGGFRCVGGHLRAVVSET